VTGAVLVHKVEWKCSAFTFVVCIAVDCSCPSEHFMLGVAVSVPISGCFQSLCVYLPQICAYGSCVPVARVWS